MVILCSILNDPHMININSVSDATFDMLVLTL